MIASGNSSHLLVIERASVTGIDDYRLIPYSPAKNFQHVQQAEIQDHSLTARALKLGKYKIFRYPDPVFRAFEHNQNPMIIRRHITRISSTGLEVCFAFSSRSARNALIWFLISGDAPLITLTTIL